jgi:Suppressor of fused protein (SUFU)
MIEVSAYDKAVARAAARAIGGEPRVIEHAGVAVLQSADRPTPGFVAHSTVSLHRVPNLVGEREPEGGPSVHWLHAAPISESERRFILAHGFDALEDRFAAAEMEYWNLDRASLA